MTQSVVSVLKRARGLVAKGWCQHAMARGISGKKVALVSRYAREFCIIGAVSRTSWSARISTYDATRHLECATRSEYLGDWNDAPGRTQAQVLRAFDKAIARAIKEEKAK